MCSWPYMFKMEWIPGKDNAIVDGLSRLSPTPVNLIKSEIELPIHQVNIIKATMKEEDVCKLQQETASDLELQAVAKAISNGWPTLRKQTHPILHDYWNYRDELSIDNGSLTKNKKSSYQRHYNKSTWTGFTAATKEFNDLFKRCMNTSFG